MLTIVSSQVIASVRQVDGRYTVRERHTDNTGQTYDLDYCAEIATDQNAHLAQSAINLAASLNATATAAEINQNITNVTTLGSLAVVTFNNSTVAANVAVLRAAYATATQQQAIMIGDYLNSLTNAQLMAAFSLSSAQVNTLRTNKLVPAASAAVTVRASVGA